jgi:hypothetical protein
MVTGEMAVMVRLRWNTKEKEVEKGVIRKKKKHDSLPFIFIKNIDFYIF